MQYYYSQGGQQHGPFSIEELRQKPIDKNTLVWKPGMAAWVSAGELPELAAVFQPITPPPLPVFLSAPDKKLERSTQIWRILSIGSFVIMIGVAWWMFSQPRSSQNQASIVNPIEPAVNQDSIDQAEREKEARLIEEELMRKEAEKKARELQSWADYVPVTIAHINHRNGFGGMNSVTVDVMNNLSYEIKWMEIWVQYIKSNGGIYKTEAIDVRDLKPGESRRLTGPGSERGTSAKCYINFIVVPALNLEIIPADT